VEKEQVEVMVFLINDDALLTFNKRKESSALIVTATARRDSSTSRRISLSSISGTAFVMARFALPRPALMTLTPQSSEREIKHVAMSILQKYLPH
jgi:hypothetical protein